MVNIASSLYKSVMERLQLSPDVLDWAAAEAGLSLVALAQKLSKRGADEIIRGRLTEPQIERFAKLTGVPLGYLFMPRPPNPREPGIADFRTVAQSRPLSRDFFDSLDEVQYKQDWYKEYLERIGADKLDFVGKYSQGEVNVLVVAKDIRNQLDLDSIDREALRSPDDLYSLLVDRSERLGILVFKNGVVGNNTRRSLAVDEFRGFVLSDPLAPVVFINGSDAPAAWTFTLAHELAHIWLGDSGVSDTSPSTNVAREKQCNSIAAEVLVPQAQFREFWAEHLNRNASTVERTIAAGRSYFRVSELVIARRALDMKLISHQLYSQTYNNSPKAGGQGSGGNFYRTLNVRNSKKFSSKVSSLAVSGAISFREAGRLLNVAPGRIETVYKRNRALST